MVPYPLSIDRDAAVVDAFRRAGLTWMQYLVAAGAMTGITSVLLVMMLSQPRVFCWPWHATAWYRQCLWRDSPALSHALEIHDSDRVSLSPSLAGFFPSSILAEMTNIGTLFAFVIVCAAVMVMRKTNPDCQAPFRAPLVPLVPILGILTCLLLMFSLPAGNW